MVDGKRPTMVVMTGCGGYVVFKLREKEANVEKGAFVREGESVCMCVNNFCF